MGKFKKISIYLFIIIFLLLVYFFVIKSFGHKNNNKESTFLVLNFEESLNKNDFENIYTNVLSLRKDTNQNYFPQLNSFVKIISPNYLITINDNLTFSYDKFHNDAVNIKTFLDSLSDSLVFTSNNELKNTEKFFIYSFIGNIISKDSQSIINDSFLSKDYLKIIDLDTVETNLTKLLPYIKNNFGLLKLELSNSFNINNSQLKTFNLINLEDRDTLLEIQLIKENNKLKINNLVFY